VPPGVELKLGAMIVIGGPEGADDGEVVDAVSQVGPPVADLQAAPPALAEADLERVQLVPRVVQALDQLSEVLFQVG